MKQDKDIQQKVLDLHGTKHEDVRRLLENFILLNKPPLTIITGNSEYMRGTLESFCGEHGISYERWGSWGEYKIL